MRWEFDLRPPVIEPRSTESEPDVLTTLPSMHMELTRDQAQNTCDWGLHINRDKDKNLKNDVEFSTRLPPGRVISAAVAVFSDDNDERREKV